ncbi:MAG: efflux RND transporter permease subunit [Deltaproteobacteria bacterium]|nr:efflux RND transporter permease subunit [Deltaproteobacteria bacterium]MCB9789246.1 efflux RND transporter permease subunit [Deltaproteobacteria bacterium]
MIHGIIEGSLRNRWLVVLATVGLVLAGIYAAQRISLDAIPDVSDTQVIIFTEFPGQAPQVVEDQVTYPLATSMLGVPGSKVVRGYSFFGLSFVYVLFEDGTDIYWARSRVLEYLNFVASRLPKGVTPQLGPDATGVGWVYEYSLKSETKTLDELRSIQDWYLRYALTAVSGVSEVASIGGYVKQYQVEVDPRRLRAYNIPLRKVKEAIQRSNSDVGGRLLELGETEFMVRGRGYIESLDDLRNVPLGVDEHGTPILLHQVGTVQLGPEIRRGLAELDGQGEVVGGIVVMRFGENALAVIERVKAKLAELGPTLESLDVELVTTYDRSKLIEDAVDTLSVKLVEEMIVVGLIMLIFLLHVRSAFVAFIVLPLGVLVSVLGMYLLGINANIMSLGGIAIAIGVMVDASVVMVENAHKHLEHDVAHGKTQFQIILASSKEVGPALFYSLLIVTVSFLPVFALGGQSGKMFSPLAYTKTFAMASSAVLAITIIPVAMYYLVRGKIRPESRNPLSRFFIWLYRPVIAWVLRRRWWTLAAAGAALLITAWPASRLGGEFMPPLNEGDLLYMPTMLPGVSITKAKEILQQTDRIIKAHPEVERVFGKIGRAETATDPAPLSMIETTVILKPRSEWREGITSDDIVGELLEAIRYPGLTDAWTMPIKTRIDMLSTGIKTPVGIKLMGADLAELARIGQEIEAVVRDIPGTRSVYAERVTGGNYYDFDIDRREAARYGMTVGDVQDVVMSAIGGMNITETVEGLERYPVNLRYGRELRDHPEALARVLVPTPTGAQVPLGQLATPNIHKGPPGIKSESARKTAWIYVDIDSNKVAVGDYVERAITAVDSARKSGAISISADLPVDIVWSGQWEYMQAAAKRLRMIIPITLAIVVLLLFMHFRNMWETLIVLLSLPFALVGGIWLMYFLGYNRSVAVDVGFIALGGLAAETGVVMLVYLNEAWQRLRPEVFARMRQAGAFSPALFRATLDLAIMQGAVDRVRPKLMTVATTVIGLLPVMFSGDDETGAQVMKRIAAPMVGGLVTSTILTLVIIPAVYALVVFWRERREFARELEAAPVEVTS